MDDGRPANRSTLSTPPGRSATPIGGELPFVGRVPELAELTQASERALAGSGSVLLFSGESGIGKSRLLNMARQEFLARGGMVTRGDASIHAGTPPYQLWIDALGRLGKRAVPTLLTRGEERPAERTRQSWHASGDDSATRRFQVASAVLASLEQVTASAPLLITLDDLQWSDQTSLELLRFLAYRCESLPLALIGAFRSGEGTSSIVELASELASERRACWMPVTALTAADVQPALAAILGWTEPAWAVQLTRHCRGNPFVLGETVRVLVVNRGELNAAAPPDLDALPLPSSVGAAIRSRLARLDHELRRIVDLLAVSGDPIAVDVLAAALDTTRETVETELRRLIDVAVAAEAPGLGVPHYQLFHHWLRDVALGLMPPAELQGWHRALAASLHSGAGPEPAPALLSAIARHFELGNDRAGAARAYRALGSALRSAHAHQEAADAFAQAIAMHPDDPRALADLEMACGDALLMSGGSGAADAYQRARSHYRALGSLRESAVAAGMAGIAHARSERHELALALYDDALALFGSLPDARHDRAWILLQRARTLGSSTARFDEALAAQHEAMELLGADALADPLFFEAALAMARTLLRSNRLEEAREILERTLPHALEREEFGLAAEIEGTLANYYNWIGDIRQSRAHTLRRQTHAEASGDRFAQRHVQSWLAFMELHAANWPEAEQLLLAAEADIDRLESPEPAAFHRQIAGMLALFQGRYDEALADLLTALEGFRQSDPSGIAWYVGCAAYAAFRAGDGALADRLIAETEALVDQLPETALLRCPPLAMLGLIAVERGRLRRARAIYEQLAPFSGHKHWVLVDRVRGVLAFSIGDATAGKAHLGLAIERAKRFGLRSELAIALAEDAHFAERSEPERRDALRAAIAQLRTLGMEGEAIRFEAQLASPVPATPELERLSARELEVLRLLARGKTNNEIAAELFISPKTVINHITHIFDKTGWERRSEAVRYAVSQGLV